MALVDVCEALSRTSLTGVHITTCGASVIALVDVCAALSWTSLTGVHIATCAASVMALVDVSEALFVNMFDRNS